MHVCIRGGDRPGLIAKICRYLGGKLHWLWLSQRGWKNNIVEADTFEELIAKVWGMKEG